MSPFSKNHYFLSLSSRSEESFKQYFSEMPWLAVPYSDEARRSRLNRLYGIQGEILHSCSGRKTRTRAQLSPASPLPPHRESSFLFVRGVFFITEDDVAEGFLASPAGECEECGEEGVSVAPPLPVQLFAISCFSFHNNNFWLTHPFQVSRR